jgi:hypothetical protein
VDETTYILREDRRNPRFWWVIERADGSVCFRLPRQEWSMAEEILRNLLLEPGCEQDRRNAA